jgi:hypothetical protein
MERLKNGPPGRMFKKTQLYFELMICNKYREKNTGRQSVNTQSGSYIKVMGLMYRSARLLALRDLLR